MKTKDNVLNILKVYGGKVVQGILKLTASNDVIKKSEFLNLTIQKPLVNLDKSNFFWWNVKINALTGLG